MRSNNHPSDPLVWRESNNSDYPISTINDFLLRLKPSDQRVRRLWWLVAILSKSSRLGGARRIWRSNPRLTLWSDGVALPATCPISTISDFLLRLKPSDQRVRRLWWFVAILSEPSRPGAAPRIWSIDPRLTLWSDGKALAATCPISTITDFLHRLKPSDQRVRRE